MMARDTNEVSSMPERAKPAQVQLYRQMKANGKGRDRQRGVVLVSIVASTLLLISLVTLVQSRVQSNLRVGEAVLRHDRQAMSLRGIREVVRGDVGLAIIAPDGKPVPPLNGEGYIVSYGGEDWTVSLQNVDGLVDLYLGSPAQFKAIGMPTQTSSALLSARDGAGSKARYANLEQSMAVYGIDSQFGEMLTQQARDPLIHLGHTPAAWQQMASRLSPLETKADQARRVLVRVIKGEKKP